MNIFNYFLSLLLFLTFYSVFISLSLSLSSPFFLISLSLSLYPFIFLSPPIAFLSFSLFAIPFSPYPPIPFLLSLPFQITLWCLLMILPLQLSFSSHTIIFFFHPSSSNPYPNSSLFSASSSTTLNSWQSLLPHLLPLVQLFLIFDLETNKIQTMLSVLNSLYQNASVRWIM